MKKITGFVLAVILGLLLCGALQCSAAGTENGRIVRIACVGDSITYGDKSSDESKYSYPAQLQNLLGDGYEVRNYGINGATLTESGWCTSYLETEQSRQCKEWNPDLILVMLGTNDSQEICWEGHNSKESYKGELEKLVREYQSLPAEPEIFLATSPEAGEGNQYGIQPEVIAEEIVPVQKELAETLGCHLIDIHEMTKGFAEKGLMTLQYQGNPDLVHPDQEGYLQMAKFMYNGIAESLGLEPMDVSSYELDSSNEKIVYSGSWGDWEDTALFMDTEKYTTSPGSTAELSFKGVGVRITGLRTPGLSYMDVYLDGERYQSVDTWVESVDDVKKHDPLFEIDSLPYGEHTLKIALNSRRDAHHKYEAKLSLDSIYVFEKAQDFENRIVFSSETGEFSLPGEGDKLQIYTSVLPEDAECEVSYEVYPKGAASITDTGLVTAHISEGTFRVTAVAQDGSLRMESRKFTVGSGKGFCEWVDDRDEQVKYYGTWTDVYNEASCEETLKESHASGNIAELTFQGTGIHVIGTVYHLGQYSYADVYLDGEKIGASSFMHNRDNQGAQTEEVVYKIDGLEDTSHKLRLIVRKNEEGTPGAGQSGVSIDGFRIYRETACDTEETETAPLKIACVGDGITYGSCTLAPQKYSYPAKLQEMLGEECIVENFAMPGASAAGGYSYKNQSVYWKSLAFKPDIVVMMLGTNDASDGNWKGKEAFVTGLTELIEAYQKMESVQEIYLVTPSYTYDTSRQTTLEEEILPAVRETAEKTECSLMDLYDETREMDKDFFNEDGLHFEDDGYYYLAALIQREMVLPKYCKLADKNELYLLLSRFQELKKEQCSGGDWSHFEIVRQRAETVLENPQANQIEVFMMRRELQAAYDELQFAEKIKVACVGDSITYGHPTSGEYHGGYPVRLQQMLGDRYEVRNFGVSSRTLNSRRDWVSYISTQEYQDSKEFQPDVVILMLGTNDSKDDNWEGEERYEEDAKALIQEYQNLPSKPVVYLGISPRVAEDWDMRSLSEPEGNYIWNSRIVNLIAPLQRSIAEKTGCRIIDIEKRTEDPENFRSYLSWDKIHPNDGGYELLGSWMYEGILTEYPAFTGDLEETVKKAEKLELEKYTAETAGVLEKCLDAAKKALETGGVQQETGAALQQMRRQLERAMSGLKEKPDEPDEPEQPEKPNKPEQPGKTPEPPVGDKEEVPSAGSTFDVNGILRYKITKSAETGGTVTVVRLLKKSKRKAVIPASVKFKNYTFRVTAIQANAFKNCRKLKSVTVGKNVSSIGKKAFYGCKGLKTICFQSTKAPKLGKQAFRGIYAKCRISVPKRMNRRQTASLKARMKKAGAGKRITYKKKK